MLVIFSLLAATASVIISIYYLQPVYESKTTLMVKGTSFSSIVDYNDILVSQQLIKDYSELIQNRSVTEKVLQEVGITDITPEVLIEMVSVSQMSDTRIFEVKVSDYSPERAKILADALSRALVSKTEEIGERGNISIIDIARIPETPSKPDIVFNGIAAFVLSAILTVLVILLIEYMDDSLKTALDIEEKLKLKVLGTIPILNIE
jgi:capsular polysaccharide biosynthesis protein